MRSSSQRLGRLLTLMTVLALVVAACSGGESDETTTTAESGEATTTEATSDETSTTADSGEDGEDGESEGGRLRVGVLDDVQAWDSSRLQSVLFPFHRNLYDTLADYEDGLNAVPRLATGWEISEAQDSVTITLRDDVVFHSGRPMTAEDVAANLEYFMDPETVTRSLVQRRAQWPTGK